MTTLEWSTLPDDVKRCVIEKLYYSDKQSLARCSKSDRSLVRKSHWIFDRFNFEVNRDSKKAIEVEHRYRMDIFTKDGDNNTLVEKYYRLEEETHPRWKFASSELFENRDFQEMASDRLNEMFRAQKWRVEDLRMDLHSTPPTFSHQISVKTVEIHAEIRRISNPELFFQMVSSIEPKVDWLKFRIEHQLPRGLESIEAVRNAERLVFSSSSLINDSDLLMLNAHFLDIWESRCTNKGIRNFVMKRLETRKPCNFFIGLSDVNVEVLTEGFDVDVSSGKTKISMSGCEFSCTFEAIHSDGVSGVVEEKGSPGL